MHALTKVFNERENCTLEGFDTFLQYSQSSDIKIVLVSAMHSLTRKWFPNIGKHSINDDSNDDEERLIKLSSIK